MNDSERERAPQESITARRSVGALVATFWLFVGVPLAWGVYNTLIQAMQLFE